MEARGRTEPLISGAHYDGKGLSLPYHARIRIHEWCDNGSIIRDRRPELPDLRPSVMDFRESDYDIMSFLEHLYANSA
jgi:hypothetical protein